MSTFWTRWSNDYEPIGEYRIRQRRKSNYKKNVFQLFLFVNWIIFALICFLFFRWDFSYVHQYIPGGVCLRTDGFYTMVLTSCRRHNKNQLPRYKWRYEGATHSFGQIFIVWNWLVIAERNQNFSLERSTVYQFGKIS